MIDDEMISIQTLVLSIALCILEHVKEELGGLEGPTTLAGAVDSSLGVATDSTHKPKHIWIYRDKDGVF